jgi:hypothetical protein
VHVVLHVVRRGGVRELAAVGVLERDGDLVRVLPAWQDERWGPGQQRLRDLLGGIHLPGGVPHIAGPGGAPHIAGPGGALGGSVSC